MHAQLLLATAFTAVVAFEIIRRQPILIGQFANRIFAPTLRSSELAGDVRFTGAFYMLAGALVTALLFPREIAATALAVLMISDSAAALVGKRWGNTPIAGKSAEGSLAFLLSAIFIAAFFAVISSESFIPFFISGCIASIVATACELYAPRLRLDDNLLIPIAFAATHILTFSILTNWTHS